MGTIYRPDGNPASLANTTFQFLWVRFIATLFVILMPYITPFQFLWVRFIEKNILNLQQKPILSIPVGTIYSLWLPWKMGVMKLSIPVGTIYRMQFSQNGRRTELSIPVGTIYSWGWIAPRRRSLLSIPVGTIYRWIPFQFQQGYKPFNSCGYDL